MSTRTLRFAFLCLPLLAGCATSEQGGDLPPPKKQVDAAGLDVSRDAPEQDAADTSVEDAGSCLPLTTGKRPCGKCGNQTRVCSPTGTWGEWSLCNDEKSFVSCSIGEVQSNACGNCGKAVDTCDPETCEWVPGTCSMEGVCAEGDKEETSASCTVAGEVRTRTCSDKCAWSGFSACSLPTGFIPLPLAPTALEGRFQHSAVWTGSDMIVWGGYGSSVSPTFTTVKNTGFAYNLAANSWKQIAAAPTALSTGRWQHSAIYGGGKMIVWGGLSTSSSTTSPRNDGAVYDPGTDTWSTTAMAVAPISPRVGHGAVWSTTTNEMIVWGGQQYQSSTGAYTYFNDGAAYDPATNTWTTIPAAPVLGGRWKHSMVWTGTEVVIYGGQGASGYLRDGARFDPKTRIWTKFPDPPSDFDARWESAAVWSGKELIVWGGYASTYVSSTYGRSDGARYTPGGSWTRFTVPMDGIFGAGTVATRYAAQAWFGGGKMFIFSGAPGTSTSTLAVAGAASYDPATDAWTTVTATGAPSPRARASVVWTGKEAIIFGGSNYTSGSTYYNDGVIFRP